MIIKTEELKSKCSDIFGAVDSTELSVLTETLELKVLDNCLFMNVTNREYFVQVKLPVDEVDEFHATVNATLFLKLISQITTPEIEFTVNDSSLLIKGNGNYKLPLIFNGSELLDLPSININNPTVEFKVSGDILNSISIYNSKELGKGVISKPVQRLYYVDDKGAITFTSGACVNKFSLEQPIKVLFNDRLVKLFKLFKGKTVDFTLGFDSLSDTIIQTKVKFEDPDVCVTAILSCDESLLNSVPVEAIRNRAEAIYPYRVVLDKNLLLQAINRMMLFTVGSSRESFKAFGIFEFFGDHVTLMDSNRENQEVVTFSEGSVDSLYCSTLDLQDLKSTLDSCSDTYVTLRFGDEQAVVLARKAVSNVIPEVRDI